MRKQTILILLGLTLSLMIGAQFISTTVRANIMEVDVNIDPDVMLLERDHGKWITAYVSGFPESFDMNNINGSSVFLQVNGIQVDESRFEIQGSTLVVKFDRALVIDALLSVVTPHMSPSPQIKQQVSLTVTGKLFAGDVFQGSDTVEIFFTQT